MTDQNETNIEAVILSLRAKLTEYERCQAEDFDAARAAAETALAAAKNRAAKQRGTVDVYARAFWETVEQSEGALTKALRMVGRDSYANRRPTLAELCLALSLDSGPKLEAAARAYCDAAIEENIILVDLETARRTDEVSATQGRQHYSSFLPLKKGLTRFDAAVAAVAAAESDLKAASAYSEEQSPRIEQFRKEAEGLRIDCVRVSKRGEREVIEPVRREAERLENECRALRAHADGRIRDAVSALEARRADHDVSCGALLTIARAIEEPEGGA